jgi:ATP-binding cassette, subfamily C (CFTR/MRP), member 1
LVAQGALDALLSSRVDVRHLLSIQPEDTGYESRSAGRIEVSPVGLSCQVPMQEEERMQQTAEKLNKEGTDTISEVDDEQTGVLGSADWAPYKFFFEACGWSQLSVALFCLLAYTVMEVGLQVCLLVAFDICR